MKALEWLVNWKKKKQTQKQNKKQQQQQQKQNKTKQKTITTVCVPGWLNEALCIITHNIHNYEALCSWIDFEL